MSGAATLPAAQRMLARNVIASTVQLVRGLTEGRGSTAIRDLMGERRRLLGELARDVDSIEAVGSLTALRHAVAESDRTLEALIG